MQSLYYFSASQSLQLYDGGSDSTLIQTWVDISNVAITASAYETSGSDFGTTLGSLRIYAYSSSVQVASFPIESTNLYFPPFPASISSVSNYTFTSSIILTDLLYTFTVPTTFTDGQLSGSGCSIYDVINNIVYVSESYDNNEGGISLITEEDYAVKVYGSGSYYFTALTINDTTYGTNVIDISSINDSSSYTFTPEAFHSYQAIFSITDLSGIS
jgi:hypothetical protein